MTRTTAFAIILGLFAAPAMAADGKGALVPRAISLKDTLARNAYRHQDARQGLPRHLCWDGDGLLPAICETANKPHGAPGKPQAPGAR